MHYGYKIDVLDWHQQWLESLKCGRLKMYQTQLKFVVPVLQ